MTDVWFAVRDPATVLAADRTTPIGTLQPGKRYRAIARDGDWVAVPGPGGSTGYVEARALVLEPAPPPAEAAPAPPAAEPGAAPTPPSPAPATTAQPDLADRASIARTGTEARPTNRLAILSPVAGFLWLFWIGSLVAIVAGYLALGQIRDANGRQRGRVLAIVGIVLGVLGMLSLPIAIAQALAS